MDRVDMYRDDRSPTIFGWAAMLLAGGGLLYFWVMGAILLLRGTESGQIRFLQDEPVWRTLYFAYPVVFVVAIVVGGVLVALRRDLASIGVAGAPVVLAIGYYFALIHLRSF
jgi:hypothetical protein